MDIFANLEMEGEEDVVGFTVRDLSSVELVESPDIHTGGVHHLPCLQPQPSLQDSLGPLV